MAYITFTGKTDKFEIMTIANIHSDDIDSFSADELIFVPLGGSAEIGMNVNLYHYNNSWLMVDLGISFPDDTMPGIDVLLPDIRYIEDRKDQLEALILTHAHEDHFGAIPYLWSRLGVPIYGTAFTIALLKRKLAESRIDIKIPLHVIDYNCEYKFKSFSIEFVQLNHSIPDPAALVIRTDKGAILHTGDWKFDSTPHIGTDTDKQRLRQIGDDGILAMVGDSTNAMVEGHTPSEDVALKGLTEVIGEADRAVAITCFASNVARINSIVTAATAHNRSVCVVGRALNRTIAAAREAGYLADLPDFVSESDANLLPPENLVIICTGSQGEGRAAMARIASGTHETIKLHKGDMTIFSSRQIPGNEAAISRVQNNLIRQGVTIITDEERPVHVSGHPARDEMSEMYGLVRPKIAIPVHGTARHLEAHAALAKSCQVPQQLIPSNGAIIRLASGKAEQIGLVDVDLQTFESGDVVPLEADFLKSRKRMLWNGSLSVSVVLDGGGELLLAPSISQTGLCSPEQAERFTADASIAVEDRLEGLDDEAILDDKKVKKTITECIRALARTHFRLRPVVDVHIMRA